MQRREKVKRWHVRRVESGYCLSLKEKGRDRDSQSIGIWEYQTPIPCEYPVKYKVR